jgi:hypothetical protein
MGTGTGNFWLREALAKKVMLEQSCEGGDMPMDKAF